MDIFLVGTDGSKRQIITYHRLWLTFTHDETFSLSKITASALGSIILSATVHKVVVEGFAISEQITATELHVMDGKGAVKSIVLAEDGRSRHHKESESKKHFVLFA